MHSIERVDDVVPPVSGLVVVQLSAFFVVSLSFSLLYVSRMNFKKSLLSMPLKAFDRVLAYIPSFLVLPHGISIASLPSC